MPSDAQKEWKAACCKDLESLHRCHVFELVDPPKDCKIIRNRWVFDLKSDGCKKARLVAKGFSQIEGIDYDETFLLVVWFETVWMMIDDCPCSTQKVAHRRTKHQNHLSVWRA
jgi:Reverse transcriptase (RNA-dependent DNA polymerase)